MQWHISVQLQCGEGSLQLYNMQSATNLGASQMWLCRLHDVFQLPAAEQTIMFKKVFSVVQHSTLNPPDDVMKKPDVRLLVDKLNPNRLEFQPGLVS